jgi:hypothetical protein
MQQVINACQRHGRKITFIGTSMVENAKDGSQAWLPAYTGWYADEYRPGSEDA